MLSVPLGLGSQECLTAVSRDFPASGSLPVGSPRACKPRCAALHAADEGAFPVHARSAGSSPCPLRRFLCSASPASILLAAFPPRTPCQSGCTKPLLSLPFRGHPACARSTLPVQSKPTGPGLLSPV